MADLPVMMHCDKLKMALSRPGCARLWLSAEQNAPQPWEARFACRNCSIGAGNAGRVVAPAAVALDEIRMICPRCERVASRLIKGKLCVSCYNRQREVIVGRNAKGNRPQLSDKLHTLHFVVIQGGRSRIVHRPNVTGQSEAILSLAKSIGGTVAFGRRRVNWPALVQSHRRGVWTPQLELAV
jgi:hypothetical protein